MFTDKGFQDVNNACSSDKVSIWNKNVLVLAAENI
jgi:hypothetical protein